MTDLLEGLELLTFPNPFSVLVVFLFGSLMGSFLNVVIYRTPLERSIVLPGSACTVCGTPLQWWHNIPIGSFFLLGGRCHYCRCRYSPRYMLLELFVASVATGLFLWYDAVCWPMVYSFIFFCLLTAVFFTDLDHWIIPDQVNFAGMALGLLGGLLMPLRAEFWDTLDWPAPLLNLLSSLLGIAAGAGFFWAIQVVGTLLARQEAMGGGDVKFAGLIGAFLGWRLALLSFLGSFFLGALVALPMLLRHGKGKDPIPFGTFMALAAMPVALWGDRMLDFLMYWPDYVVGY